MVKPNLILHSLFYPINSQFTSGQALKAGAEVEFQLPTVDSPDDIVAGACSSQLSFSTPRFCLTYNSAQG
jgi:hypothetical protein